MNYCSLHERQDCTLCDECNHDTKAHLNGHDQDPALAAYIFANATCWAENICLECNPTLQPRAA